MTLITCVDKKNGVAFNRRRQSSDAAVLEDMLRFAEDNDCSIEIFDASVSMWERFLTAKGIPELSGEAKAMFVELDSCKEYEAYYSTVILYRWDKVYPADTVLELDLSNYRLVEIYEFPGTSHEAIRRETYERVNSNV